MNYWDNKPAEPNCFEVTQQVVSTLRDALYTREEVRQRLAGIPFSSAKIPQPVELHHLDLRNEAQVQSRTEGTLTPFTINFPPTEMFKFYVPMEAFTGRHVYHIEWEQYRNAFGGVGELDLYKESLTRSLFNSREPKTFLFTTTKNLPRLLDDALLPAAQHFHDRLKIYAGVPAKCADAMRTFGIDASEGSADLPALVIHDTVNDLKLVMPSNRDEGITIKSITQFWTDFLEGNIAHLRRV